MMATGYVQFFHELRTAITEAFDAARNGLEEAKPGQARGGLARVKQLADPRVGGYCAPSRARWWDIADIMFEKQYLDTSSLSSKDLHQIVFTPMEFSNAQVAAWFSSPNQRPGLYILPRIQEQDTIIISPHEKITKVSLDVDTQTLNSGKRKSDGLMFNIADIPFSATQIDVTDPDFGYISMMDDVDAHFCEQSLRKPDGLMFNIADIPFSATQLDVMDPDFGYISVMDDVDAYFCEQSLDTKDLFSSYKPLYVDMDALGSDATSVGFFGPQRVNQQRNDLKFRPSIQTSAVVDTTIDVGATANWASTEELQIWLEGQRVDLAGKLNLPGGKQWMLCKRKPINDADLREDRKLLQEHVHAIQKTLSSQFTPLKDGEKNLPMIQRILLDQLLEVTMVQSKMSER